MSALPPVRPADQEMVAVWRLKMIDGPINKDNEIFRRGWQQVKALTQLEVAVQIQQRLPNKCQGATRKDRSPFSLPLPFWNRINQIGFRNTAGPIINNQPICSFF